ncbi:MAG: hypothetical protein IJU44_07155 [Kiritimatiellae bacterium]|nr:hypothetical protein [Kiritimatiellia bacterium]
MKQFTFYALAFAAATAGAAVPSHWDGGRVPPVHRLTVKDVMGDEVVPSDPNALPVSTRQTCNMCHDYEVIASGWHFNAGDTNACPGRMSEPWFAIDPSTGSQIPVSQRGYPGTFTPEAIGMGSFEFTHTFGRNFPGGGIGEPDAEGLLSGRWNVSGPLEINCFACHDQSGFYDHSEYVKQVVRENFAWAMSAAMGWGNVDGMGERMPDYWGMLNGLNKDDSIFRVPPNISYDSKQFDSKNRLVLPVGKPKNQNCLNCHGVTQSGAPNMAIDGDIHLRAGMSCTDCHRNGADHKISRGYECKETMKCDLAASLTCAGCHVADKGKAGRYGAPAPKHVGLPVSHLEQLSCTVCHSGVTKNGELAEVTTSRANRMGVYGRAKWLTDAPYILEPVFVRNDKSGKIEPRRMAWPAYWGTRTADGVKPLPVSKVSEIAGQTLSPMKRVGAVLKMLDTNPNIAAGGRRPVFAVNGTLYAADVDGIPEKFGDKAGLDGLFYAIDPSRYGGDDADSDDDDNLPEQKKKIVSAIAEKFRAEVEVCQGLAPVDYDPDMDSKKVATEQLKLFEATVKSLVDDQIAEEKEDFDKLSADEKKSRKDEILADINATFTDTLKDRLDDINKNKKQIIEDLITTIEASPFYSDAIQNTDGELHQFSGAVVASGKLFYHKLVDFSTNDNSVVTLPPEQAAKLDLGLVNLKTQEFKSLLPQDASKAVTELADKPQTLTEEMVAAALKQLADAGIEKPVYIGHGQVWSLENGELTAKEEAVAKPVSWAVGHDVRPARMARGAKPVKCADCHTTDSKFFFGKVASTGPLLTDKRLVKCQSELMKVSGSYHWAFGSMFLVRPFFKIFLWVVFAILALVAVAFTAAAVPVFLNKFGGIPYNTKCEKCATLFNRLAGCAMGCAGLYLGCSGAWGWLRGGMTGYLLVFHQVAGGLFCAALLVLIWFRGANRLATRRSFWWMLAMSLAVLVVFTAVAPMMTIFGDGWQRTLLQAHRCSTFCFLAVAAWMLFSGGRKE